MSIREAGRFRHKELGAVVWDLHRAILTIGRGQLSPLLLFSSGCALLFIAQSPPLMLEVTGQALRLLTRFRTDGCDIGWKNCTIPAYSEMFISVVC